MNCSSFLKCKVNEIEMLCYLLPWIIISTSLGTVSYLCGENRQDLHAAQQYAEVPDPPGSLAFLQMVNELMTEHSLHFPQTTEDAICLYAELVVLVEAEMY